MNAQARGYKFVTVSQLLGLQRRPLIAQIGVPSADGGPAQGAVTAAGLLGAAAHGHRGARLDSGLAGYVYLIGGVITWVRLVAARLPADPLAAIVDPRVLFAVGLKAIVFVAVVLAVLCLLAYPP